MVTPGTLEQRFNPANLRETEELGEEAEKRLNRALPGEEQDEAPVEDIPRVLPIVFEWKDGRGKVWSGRFENEILSIAKRQATAILEATLNGDMRYDAMPIGMRIVNHAIAHMHYSLSKKNRPEWSKDLRKLDDPNLILALWDEVSSHEDKFLGLDAPPEASEEGA
jgi:hypothetical protein